MASFTGHDLCCRRGGRIVFRGLDFAVGDGEALILTGPNGSGKSTLLRLMAGLLPRAAGKMAWDGVDIADDPDAHHARIAYVSQSDAVKPLQTALENVIFWARLNGAEHPESAAMDALEAMGMHNLADVPGRYLSAGQTRRVNIARIMAADHKVWLLDEPVNGLDAESRDALRQRIEAHRTKGGMVICALHDNTLFSGKGTMTLNMTELETADAREDVA